MHLSDETIKATRQWFHDNALACIAEVKSGAVRVNNPEKYFEQCERRAADALQGKGDHTFTFQQRAYFIQTGVCVPLLSPKANTP